MSNPSRVPAPRRGLIVAALVALAATSAIVVMLASSPAPAPLDAPIDPRYPDLAMAPIGELLVGHEEGGRVYLRFSATLVNIGTGPLLIAAHRPFPLVGDWQVAQQIADADGMYSERLMPTELVFGGDGHDHWHAVGAVAHRLESMDGQPEAGLVKSGFCFFDNVAHQVLPGAPSTAVHAARACGTQGDRDIAMGLSVGWGDEYQWYLLDQAIEISAVPDGRHRLRATADPAGEIAEEDESNNDVVTEVEISTVDGLRRVTKVEGGAE